MSLWHKGGFHALKGVYVGAGLSNILIPPMIDSFCASQSFIMSFLFPRFLHLFAKFVVKEQGQEFLRFMDKVLNRLTHIFLLPLKNPLFYFFPRLKMS